MVISLRQLEYAVAVGDTRGFHKAAARCHVSQPALSAQIKELEDSLGVMLFERDRRSVMITPAGEEIVERARRILREVRELGQVAEQARDPFAGTLRVGVIPTIAPYLLPEVTPGLAKKWPKLKLVFREEKTEDVVAHLESGALDAGLVALEADLGALAHEVVMKDPFVVALPRGHALAKKKTLDLGELDACDVLLLDEGHCFRTQALALCERAGARENEFRATSLATLAQMVTSGTGVTLLPSLAVPVENRRGQIEVRPFRGPHAPSRTIALVWRKTSPLAPVFHAIAKQIRRT
jgi:LysR family hydrogen peroxide-inducible transcriptional activator